MDQPVHHDKPVFLWQESLKRFVSDLSLVVESQITESAQLCMKSLSATGQLDKIKLCVGKRGTKMEYPVTVWKVHLCILTACLYTVKFQNGVGRVGFDILNCKFAVAFEIVPFACLRR